MVWIKTTTRPHRCKMPLVPSGRMADFWIGSEWECDVCLSVWTITNWLSGGATADLVPDWEEL